MIQAVFGIVGWKNSGKTTLAAALVTELTKRGFRIATLKHAHHAFDIDHEGTDSHRHRTAGAKEVAIVSGKRWAIIHELDGAQEPPLTEMLARLSPCDLVLIEGFKRENHPKLECRRQEARNLTFLAAEEPTIVAVAADHETETGDLPSFDLGEVEQIADFIVRHTGIGRPAR
ncbi:molybdopterin-guanine dinucleotide biosynthesis protein B [Nitratireductor kimnyeongensis]|uniref:Molybdopterin-guanine dinucleotide biosynthesis protein B n=1 Tax=Nitratireductor kimnyeongensis TaxID=430679 RepID=A0ABW0T8Z2_9HYPH|nr:molybdopterin-guanine dinucleotide biosynthesis protein B [Nitratireductor kimnyeongensis]QZZ35712.1 molybdopterin-guanine dinucleotide biosynthesis protein B [Nitratireductor kimnyeongensis]